jgi:hypothetical protein
MARASTQMDGCPLSCKQLQAEISPPRPCGTAGRRSLRTRTRPSPIHRFVSWCHARASYYAEAFAPMLPHDRPPRRRWPDALPGAGGVAWAVANGEWPPVPGRGMRGSPALVGWRPYSQELASVVLAPGAEMEVHPAALPLDLVDLAFAVLLPAGLEGEQFCVPRQPLQRGQQACTVMRSGWRIKGVP